MERDCQSSQNVLLRRPKVRPALRDSSLRRRACCDSPDFGPRGGFRPRYPRPSRANGFPLRLRWGGSWHVPPGVPYTRRGNHANGTTMVLPSATLTMRASLLAATACFHSPKFREGNLQRKSRADRVKRFPPGGAPLKARPKCLKTKGREKWALSSQFVGRRPMATRWLTCGRWVI